MIENLSPFRDGQRVRVAHLAPVVCQCRDCPCGQQERIRAGFIGQEGVVLEHDASMKEPILVRFTREENRGRVTIEEELGFAPSELEPCD